jgi:microcystin-dependent protein
MVFQVKSGVSSGVAVTLPQALSLSETTATFSDDVSTGKLQEGSNDLIPAGSIIMYGAASAPGGWYLCEGGAISRSTYAALFSAIGTTYGVGDGSTTFNVPDFRDRAPYGASTFTLGSKTAGEVNASGQNSTGTGTTGSTGGSTVANTTGSGGPTTHSVTTSSN